MFVRVKKIGGYKYLYLVENALGRRTPCAAGDRRRWGAVTRSRHRGCWIPRSPRQPAIPGVHRALALLPRRTPGLE